MHTVNQVAVNSAGKPVPLARCQPATLVEHAHTRAEHALHTALWNFGEPADSAAGFRDVSLGYDKVAALIGSSKPHVKRLLEALLRKLAIEVVGEENSRIRQGRTYRVYSQADTLRRRREAGYLWCFRDRAAVELVKMIDEPVNAEIRMWMDGRAAAEKLIWRCQSADANASEEEIRYFLKISVAALRSRRLGLTLPPDWQETLITSVAQYFQPPAFELQSYRAEHPLRRIGVEAGPF